MVCSCSINTRVEDLNMNVYAIALVFTHVFLAPAGQTTKQGSLLHVIANEIQDRKISKLVVLQYPQYAGSIFTITPAELNKVYQFRTEVRQLTLWGRTREFVALLQTPTGTTAHRRSPGEVRLACLFYDNNGNQRHTIYINTRHVRVAAPHPSQPDITCHDMPVTR